MEWVLYFIEVIRHLDVHLNQLVTTLGPWFYLAMFTIIFCETGLVVTPFLPGDSLLFALGALCASTGSAINLWAMGGTLLTAAILGDALNYALGYWVGPKVFRYESSLLFNKNHLLKAQAFYEKYGAKTIILARFVPIVRTFAPFVGGIGKMTYPVFFVYNVIGGIAWVALCMGAGVFFGQIPWVKQNFEVVVLGIIVVSVVPILIEIFMTKKPSEPMEANPGNCSSAQTTFQSKAG